MKPSEFHIQVNGKPQTCGAAIAIGELRERAGVGSRHVVASFFRQNGESGRVPQFQAVRVSQGMKFIVSAD
jgi:hypothetical protein